ncbi:hypothetical protein ACFOYW_10870 [Gryllotalpicola reticulitermitis]|uniref:Uncharacterized protein n=1 Tax=Gryllotalpicola reticulitermitis TaxID=1184153 RepID=A0ABV8Q9M0_9MICO
MVESISPSLGDADSAHTKPANIVALERGVGQCQLAHAAYVEDRWRQQQVLSAAEEKVQKPQFLRCLTAAGVDLPSDTSDGNLNKWLMTPAWFEGLSAERRSQADACMSEFADLVNTFAK